LGGKKKDIRHVEKKKRKLRGVVSTQWKKKERMAVPAAPANEREDHRVSINTQGREWEGGKKARAGQVVQK